MMAAGVGLGLWAVLEEELSLALPADRELAEDDFQIRLRPLVIGCVILLAAFIAFFNKQYKIFNLIPWLVGLGFVLYALWTPRPGLKGLYARLTDFVRKWEWNFRITGHMVLVALAFGIGVYFRVARMGEVVPEMFSDHAEKLLDVYDVLQGQTRIFFPRNTGREGLQFYLIAWTARLFGTGISFLSMKIGTVALGIFMLPYLYLLGKELGNKNVGLLAMLLAGVAFWPNILARVALRFILYPAFAAPTLYYLVRGLRTGQRRYFILSGIFLGIGLHGYTPFRAVPILVVVVIGLYWLQKRGMPRFSRSTVWLGIIAFVSLMVFLPLLRVWVQEPAVFNQRIASRLTSIEAGDQMAQGWALVGVFLRNVWNGLLMFNWDSGEIWVNTLPGAPSLDLVTGAAFVLGFGLVLVRYAAKWRWEDGFLLLGLPVLMLPSTLVLAFPHENPAPNRAGGAVVVVFVLAAMGIEAVLRAIRMKLEGKAGLRTAVVIGLALVLIVVGHNAVKTFETYPAQYRLNAKNTSDLGAVIQQFTDTVGTQDQAWVVTVPHWVDTRLVGMNAGFPIKDFAIWAEDLDQTLTVPSPKLFLVKLDDEDGLSALIEMYPQGRYSLYEAEIPFQSFFIFYVP
jgi:NADH:ubiquinone oxidoreductase subunit 6 (subunit J)